MKGAEGPEAVLPDLSVSKSQRQLESDLNESLGGSSQRGRVVQGELGRAWPVLSDL